MIYLIRHGETEANRKHIYCGSTNLSLSEAGVEKLLAKGLGIRRKVLGYSSGDVSFVTSGMKRTEQTLKLIFGNVPHHVEERFREIDFGIFEMQSYHDLKDTPEYQEWLSGDNEKNVCPGGESGQQMEARVMEAFNEWRSVTSDLVIVTHGGVIAAIMTDLFPEENRTRFDWQPAPGCGYKLNIKSNSFEDLNI